LAFPPTREALKEQMGDLEPLTADDIAALSAEIAGLLRTQKYRHF
jgi:hypothetical protein